MKKTYMWFFKTIVLSIMTGWFFSGIQASDDQVLYSINMPGNPFQQPYYQMMIKKDNENLLVNFNGSTTSETATTGNVFDSPVKTFALFSGNYASGEKYTNSSTYCNTDYGAFYVDSTGRPYALYGISPYVMRGYTEGAAETLYMQRPTQVSLPFQPLFEGNGSSDQIPIVATLPDYQDIFLAYTRGALCASVTQGALESVCSKETISTTAQQPSWYTYVPQRVVTQDPDFFHVTTTYTNGSAYISYGQVANLGTPIKSSLRPALSVWSIGTYALNGSAALLGTDMFPSYGLFSYNGFYDAVKAITVISPSDPFFILSGQPVVSFLGDPYASASNPIIFSFAPVISPGYNGYSNPSNSGNQEGFIETVLPQGDLGGNFTGYLSTVNNSQSVTTAYDGTSVPSGMNLFQLFAQNMQWFSGNSTGYLGVSSALYNASPGQGIFSDAMQLAAIQADFVPISGSSSNSSGSASNLFYGSYNNLSELSVLINKKISINMSQETTSIPLVVQQPMLSKITVNHFKRAPYMSYAGMGYYNQTASQMVSVANYYAGIAKNNRSSVYLPVYFSDPGRPVDQPGWNYCDNADDTYTYPLYYDQKNAAMSDFTNELGGTRLNLIGIRAANQLVS